MSSEKPLTPKIFISYSWSSPEHEQWVLDLATRLVTDGVEVILDKWDLREGQDKITFMERMVNDESVSKVLAVCDKKYAEKANERRGGVGTESQIISKEVYERVDQRKFIALVTEYYEDGRECVPTFFKDRIFIDMSSEEKSYENYARLVRAIYDKPQHVKPQLGKAPSYLFDETKPQSRTGYKLQMLKRAIQDDKKNVVGLVADYLRDYLEALEDYRISDPVLPNFDEKVVAALEKSVSYRDEFIEFITLVATYREDEVVYREIFEFLQGLLRYTHKPEGITTWKEESFDNFRFMAFEVFLYTMTALVKCQRFTIANMFLSEAYFDSYLAGMQGEGIVTFSVFDFYPESLERFRKNRLNLNVLSVTADLLRKRAYHKDFNFKVLRQTDFILYLRSILHPIKQYGDWWSPRTLAYAEFEGAFEIFARAASSRYFSNLEILLGVADREDLVKRYQKAVEENRTTKSSYVSVERLMNLDKLDTF
jgi:hypothetical protein